MAYFSFQGKVYIGTKDSGTGQPNELYFVGNSPEVVLNFETTTIDHKESTSCSRLTDFQLETEQRVSLRVVIEELLPLNMQKALRSTVVSKAGTSVTNEQIGPDSGLAVTNTPYGRTKYADISSVTLTDSATPIPNTLVLDTDYSIESADYGLIKWLGVGGDTQPYLIDYTYAAQTIYPFFNTAQLSYYVMVDLCNTAESNAKYRLELYKVQLQPTNEFAIINDELGRFELEGAALYDSTLGTDTDFGNFGRLIVIT
jgi:hypothetical protein